MRFIIHPGFHKTGTKSLQRTLHMNRDALSRHFRLRLKDALTSQARAAHAYSRHPTPAKLLMFRAEIAEFCEGLSAMDPRPVLLSQEDLCGHMPGKYHITSYASAPILLDAMVTQIRQNMGHKVDIDIYLTWRSARPWIRSLYFQVLRGTRLTDDFEAFQARIGDGANLENTVAQIRKKLATSARVNAAALEQCAGHALGPAGLFLETFEHPTKDLRPCPPQNKRIEPLISEFLALNRSDLNRASLSDAKRKLYRQASARAHQDR